MRRIFARKCAKRIACARDSLVPAMKSPLLGNSVAQAEEKETGRLESFSDGVFSIAITLLALNLAVPHLSANSSAPVLGRALAVQWPSYVAFFTSFFTILVMWVNHHRVFRLIHKTSAQLMYANGFLLMMTTAVPFSTGLLSEYFSLPGARLAAAVYSGTFVLIALGYRLVWTALLHNRSLFKSNVPASEIETVTKNYRWGIPLYMLATLAAYFSVYASVGICTALWVFWAATSQDCVDFTHS
jgi:uncharacterized membrane protein